MRKGLALVLSAPSGAGKSTLCRELLRRSSGIRISVSCTTRPPRPGEKPGRDYYFLSEREFARRQRAGRLLEWARVHDYYYGTPKGPVMKSLKSGVDVLLNIDTQGALSVRSRHPEAVLVFVAPPSWRELVRRLRRRGLDSERVIRRRLVNARRELAEAGRYDYLVIHKDLKEAVGDLAAIRRAERLKRARSPALLKALKKMAADIR
jgi:guanylate kinase